MSDAQPVHLAASRRPEWIERFEAVRARIASLLPDAAIEHVGSTAVPDLDAKDVVDVLVGVAAGRLDPALAVLSDDGFDLEGSRADHAWLSLPTRARRETIVHVVPAGETQWRDRIDFRDILRASPPARARYLALKRRLAGESTGWGPYTAGKAELVQEILAAHRAGRMGILGP